MKISLVTVRDTAAIARDSLLCLALILALIGSLPSQPAMNGGCMIEFTGASNQYVNFGQIMSGLAEKTFVIQFRLDRLPTAGEVFFPLVDHTFSGSGWALVITSSGNILFEQAYSGGTNDFWVTTSAPLAGGNSYIFVATYKNTPPAFTATLNGASVPVTHSMIGVGSVEDPSSASLHLGGSLYFPSIDGKIGNVAIYNRILTAAEIADISASRRMIVNDNGLVFHALCDGVSGLASFDGATLGGSNYFAERIAGVLGAPTGSPLGFADNYLSIGD